MLTYTINDWKEVEDMGRKVTLALLMNECKDRKKDPVLHFLSLWLRLLIFPSSLSQKGVTMYSLFFNVLTSFFSSES